MKRLRRMVAEAIWTVGSWLYPYSKSPDADDVHRCYWEASVTWRSTAKEADAIFERITGACCAEPDHHPMAPCNFLVGGLRMVPGDNQED